MSKLRPTMFMLGFCTIARAKCGAACITYVARWRDVQIHEDSGALG
jgi:hypothetical protein